VFKCTASEGLSLIAVLAHFVNNTLLECEDDRARHGAAFLLLVEVVELLEVSARCAVALGRISTAISTYLNTFKSLYGTEPLIEKHHMALHLLEMLPGYLPNCFVLERKHKHPKRFSQSVMNTSCNWDASVLRECTSRHIAVLSSTASVHFAVETCLVNPHKCNRKLACAMATIFGSSFSFECSREARINEHEHVSKGDVVMVRTANGAAVGKVHAHVGATCVQGTLIFSLIETWELQSSSIRSSCWKQNSHTKLVNTSDIMYACVWSPGPDFTATVLHPTLYRM
jgi:hypothetical protein